MRPAYIPIAKNDFYSFKKRPKPFESKLISVNNNHRVVTWCVTCLRNGTTHQYKWDLVQHDLRPVRAKTSTSLNYRLIQSSDQYGVGPRTGTIFEPARLRGVYQYVISPVQVWTSTIGPRASMASGFRLVRRWTSATLWFCFLVLGLWQMYTRVTI